MKCGRELKEQHVFCDRCQTEMARYPVKPTVTVQLPPRQPVSAPKKRARRKHDVKPEEQIRRLRSALRWAYLLLAVALLAFVLTAVMLLQVLERQEQPESTVPDTIGRNYTIQESQPTE